MVSTSHRFALPPVIAVVMAVAMLGLSSFSRCHAAIEAVLDRDSVSAGQGATLTVQISGRAARPEIPAVENLIVHPGSESQSIQIFNGTTTVSTTYTYVVGSQTAGDYEIPAIEITLDGEKQSSAPLRLKVLASGAAQPPTGMPGNPGGSQDPPPEPPADTGEKQFGFLTVELSDSERKHAYVGEIAPVRIRAWLPVGARMGLRSGIQPEGKGFTLHNVSQNPRQTQQMRDGKQYTVVTWFGGISATRAGKLPASLSLDATVAVRDPSAPRPQRRRTGGPFDDPFFDSAFAMHGPMIEKDVTLKSDDQEIEVLPLPVEGRPVDFTGAVGDFKFDAVDIPSSWKTGEPRQIAARLSGSGNFALMNAPAPSPPEAWKTYTGKEEFTPGDETSFAGSKTFQFSAVPLKGGEQDMALSFSYFDPGAGTYKTIASEQRKISVMGEDVAEDPAPPSEAPPEPARKAGGLVGQHTAPVPASTLTPLVSRFAFVEMLSAAGVMGMAGALLGAFRVRRENPARRSRVALEKAVGKARDEAASSRDVTAFFSAARLAIQHRLGALWNQPPHAITTAEVAARVSPDSPVARFFREADRSEYGVTGSGEILPEWRALLDEALASLTRSPR